MSQTEGWMPLFVTRYLNDTGQLNTAQHGAYLLLLMHYWRHGPLDDDDETLAAIAKLDCRVWRKQFAATIRKFFRCEDGHLLQKRMETERARAADISSKRRAAAFSSHREPPTGGGKKTDAKPKPNGANAHANAPAKAIDKAPNDGPIAPANAVSKGANAPALAPVHCTLNTSKDLNLLSFKEEEAARAREPEAPSEAAVRAARLASAAEVSALPGGLGSVIQGLGRELHHVEYAAGAYQPKPAVYKAAAETHLRPRPKSQPLVGAALAQFRRAGGIGR